MQIFPTVSSLAILAGCGSSLGQPLDRLWWAELLGAALGWGHHAYEEANADRLKFDEVYFSALNGVVIEEYQDDSPYPSVLVFGQTFGGDPVHSVWAYNQMKRWTVLITVYRPDPNRWISCK
jgi:hypothetical protein